MKHQESLSQNIKLVEYKCNKFWYYNKQKQLNVESFENYSKFSFERICKNNVKLTDKKWLPEILAVDYEKLLEQQNEYFFKNEKLLEDYIIDNWNRLPISLTYDLYPKQFRQVKTDSGPMDLLAITKDKKEILVIELKKIKTSDKVIGQIARYMGWCRKNICLSDEKIKGLIITPKNDYRLDNALLVCNNISYSTYEIGNIIKI